MKANIQDPKYSCMSLESGKAKIFAIEKFTALKLSLEIRHNFLEYPVEYSCSWKFGEKVTKKCSDNALLQKVFGKPLTKKFQRKALTRRQLNEILRFDSL